MTRNLKTLTMLASAVLLAATLTGCGEDAKTETAAKKARLPISLLTQIGDCAFCCFLSFWKGEDQLVPTNGTNVPCLFQSLKSRESSLQRVRG